MLKSMSSGKERGPWLGQGPSQAMLDLTATWVNLQFVEIKTDFNMLAVSLKCNSLKRPRLKKQYMRENIFIKDPKG